MFEQHCIINRNSKTNWMKTGFTRSAIFIWLHVGCFFELRVIFLAVMKLWKWKICLGKVLKLWEFVEIKTIIFFMYEGCCVNKAKGAGRRVHWSLALCTWAWRITCFRIAQSWKWVANESFLRSYLFRRELWFELRDLQVYFHTVYERFEWKILYLFIFIKTRKVDNRFDFW